MTPEQQRISIAEACGWKRITEESLILGIQRTLWMKPGQEQDHGFTPPDYLNDLNACHEMERVLKEGREQDTYAAALGDLTGGRQIDLGATCIRATTKIIFATAAQRCEAFLRTIGKWEDDK